jgi:hypothetical protein
MSTRKKRRLAGGAIMLLCCLLAAAEAWALRRTWRENRRAETKLRRLAAEHVRLVVGVRPEAERRLEAGVREAERRLADSRSRIPNAPPPLPASDLKGLDAFLALSSYAERCRRRAGDAGVETAPGERFGFASYTNRGPADPFAAGVLEQQERAERVLQRLFSARPSAFRGLRRTRVEAPDEGPAKSGRASQTEEGAAGDFFVLASGAPDRTRREGRAPTGFRIEFDGATETLRQFLNALAGREPEAIVRTIEVETLPRAEERPASEARHDRPATLLPRLGRFAVTIGWQLEEPAAASGAMSSSVGGDSGLGVGEGGEPWPEASASMTSAGRGFELFSPPRLVFDAALGEWIPPAADSKPPASASAGWELVEVMREPFRLQLVGHVGDERRPVLAIQDRASGETFAVRPGEPIGNSGWMLRRFEPPDGTSAETGAGRAVVATDPDGREETRLVCGERALGGTLAVVCRRTHDGEVRAFHVGDVAEFGGTRYRLETVEPAPPEAVWMEVADDAGAGSLRTLRLCGGSAAEASGGGELREDPGAK